jgi:hypothetical protein
MNRFHDATSVESLIYQTVGAASVCWENPGGAGIFDDRKAAETARDALERLYQLTGHYNDHEPLV